ncbi:MAG TPA: PIN domain-containing protein [Mycobacteriales bacterium]|nr:PIN domain-containing protein [Mycobacteriales bacterium]
MTQLACDTSVALPLLVRRHTAHDLVTRWADGRTLHLAGHALVETFSVLTRLPTGLRASPADAARLLAARFVAPLLLDEQTALRLPEVLAGLDIAGGATYDALVALAARDHGATLATLDARARGTYEMVGVRVVLPG